MEENFEKPKKKWLPILIVAIILVLLIGGVIGYKLITSNPKRLINKVIDEGFAMLESKNDIKTQKSSLAVSMNIDTKDSELKEIVDNYKINSSKITLNTEMDANQEYLKENIIANYNGKQVLDGNVIIQNGDIYLYAEELFNKYVEISSDYMEDNGVDIEIITELFESYKKISPDKNNELVEVVKNEIKEFLNDKEFTKENTKIEINDKEVNTTKSSVVLTEKDCYQLTIKILKTLKGNEYFISLFENADTDVTDTLDDMIANFEDMSDSSDKKNTITISVYTKGFFNELVKVEMIVVDDSSEICMGISYTIQDNENSVIEVSENTESTKVSGLKNIGTLSINKKDNKTTFGLKIKEYSNLSVIIDWTQKTDEEGTIVVTLQIPTELMDYEYKDVKATITCDYSIYDNASISKENTKNSVEIDKLTSADISEIYKNLQNSKLYDLIEQFMPTSTDYNTNDSYDY